MQNNFVPLSKRKKFNYKCGETFGRLTYTGFTYTRVNHGRWVRFIEAVCVCGVVKEYNFQHVSSGQTQSCGCLRRDVIGKNFKTHGLSKHPLYLVYHEMIKRCYDKENEAFSNYGGRNIEVWQDWRDDFVVFYDWCMSNGYKEGLSLDRQDNDGNYAPHNCRFATRAEQNRNRRNNRMYAAFGETKCLFDWGLDERCKVSAWGLRSRMDKEHWKDRFEDALTIEEDRKRASANSKSSKQLTAFGETKCITAWAKDERCVVGFDRLRDRIAEGWNHQEAITTIQKDSKEIELTAFGETKSMTNWLKDERCIVKRDAMRDRYRKGWAHEEILTTPPRTGKTASLYINKSS